MSEDWHKASDGAADLRQQVAQDLGSEQDDDLNARLKAAGMYSIPEMMGVTPLSRWTVQAGMTDLTFFEKWLERRLAQSLRMRVGYELGDNDKDNPGRWAVRAYYHPLILLALLGALMGMFGASLNLQAQLQSPWVLVPFAAFFALFAVAMFGFFELRLPGFIREPLDRLAGDARGGSILGAATLGVLSSLLVSPCVSAPLAASLLYISASGDAWGGGLQLFALGLGASLWAEYQPNPALSALPVEQVAPLEGKERRFGTTASASDDRVMPNSSTGLRHSAANSRSMVMDSDSSQSR